MKLVRVEGPENYVDVSPSFEEELEKIVALREFVTVAFRDTDTERKLSHVRIASVTPGRGGRYIQIHQSGTEYLIRLDTIIAINDVRFNELKD